MIELEEGDKIVYFVRHAESMGNAHGIHQHAGVELSERGLHQAEILARRLASVNVEIILSSTFARAKKTAEIINTQKHVDLEFSDLLGEIRQPSEIRGRSGNDPDVIQIREMIRAHNDEPTWRYSDEENFPDRIMRAHAALQLIYSHPQQKILVVSHGGIVRTFVACMFFGDDITQREYWKMLSFLHMDNTGISVCKYHGTENRWSILSWNDRAHVI